DSLFEENEAAVDLEDLMRRDAQSSDFVTTRYPGGPAYLLAFYSMLFRAPLSWDARYARPLLGLERALACIRGMPPAGLAVPPVLSPSMKTIQPLFQVPAAVHVEPLFDLHTPAFVPLFRASLRARLSAPINSLVVAASRFDCTNVLIAGAAKAARIPAITR